MQWLNLQNLKLNLLQILACKGTINGISYISNRCRKANNKSSNAYNLKQELKHIYLDANNLYGYTMCKFGLKWIDIYMAIQCVKYRLKWIDTNEFDFNKYKTNSC